MCLLLNSTWATRPAWWFWYCFPKEKGNGIGFLVKIRRISCGAQAWVYTLRLLSCAEDLPQIQSLKYYWNNSILIELPILNEEKKVLSHAMRIKSSGNGPVLRFSMVRIQCLGNAVIKFGMQDICNSLVHETKWYILREKGLC